MTGFNRVLACAIVLLGATFSALPVAAQAPGPVQRELRIDITRGRVEPLPIAVPAMVGASPNESQLGRDVAQVVAADLERSGLFAPINQGAFIEDVSRMGPTPRFGDWRLINAQALVTGQTTTEADGRLRVDFRLWDVFSERQLIGFSYTTTPQAWRRIAHIIADKIYEKLTGEGGYFDTRIVYISESGPQNQRVKRLAIMDQDGANHRFLTDGRSLVLTPRFSPTTQEITYLSYSRGIPKVFIFNVETGQQELLGEFPGMTFAPRFSPDGNRVIMSLAVNGATDIYTIDLRTKRATQLTQNAAINTSPSYSPDAGRIVFNSDRGGSQQLYTMNADGSDVRRISPPGGGRYGTPVWSPRGDLIAFTKIEGGQFFIGVMRPDGSGERLLTKAFLVEAPTWAPNGRVLMYFKQQPTDSAGRGTTRLYSIDLTGYNEREVITPQDASDPAWSPLIP
jgi:TolB protein